MHRSEDLTIRQIALTEALPARALNLCLDNSLTTIQQLLVYQRKYRNFLAIRNCGNKSNNELVHICEKYKDYFVESEPLTSEMEPDVMLRKYIQLAPHQKLLVKRYFDHLFSKPGSQRHNSATIFSEIIDADGFFAKIMLKDFQFLKSHNLINYSSAAFNQLTLKIFDFIEKIQFLHYDHLEKANLKWLVEHFIPNQPVDFSENIGLMFDETGKLRVFALIKYVLDSCMIFHQTEETLFAIFYTGRNSAQPSIISIISKTKQSKNNILKVKRRLKPKIQNLFSFLTLIPPDNFVEYNFSDICIVINDTLAKKINKAEGTNFNFRFCSIIFELFLWNTHSIIGDRKIFEDNLKNAYKRKKENHFLINSRYCEYFDFENFIRDIYRKLNERPRKVYSLEFHDYLFGFLTTDGIQHINIIAQICKSILDFEFGLVVNIGGVVEFVSRARKCLYHYYYEILDEKGSIMTVDEIIEAVKNKYPLLKFSEKGVAKMMLYKPHLFIFIGRTYTYGLRKWETEQAGIKGGTLYQIVEQYLLSEGEPKHISDILSHVNHYRNTSAAKLLANLKLGSGKRFRKYEGNKIGLSTN